MPKRGRGPCASSRAKAAGRETIHASTGPARACPQRLLERAAMRMVAFGLSVRSSWGNGHATLWRGRLRALARRGPSVTFFEHDVPYYAATRDLHAIPGGDTVPSRDCAATRGRAARGQAGADGGVGP